MCSACLMQTQVPTQSWGNNSCFDCLWHVLLIKLSTSQTRNISPCSFYPQAEIMTRRDEYAIPRVIQVAGEYLSFQSVSKFDWSYLHSELIGEFDDECPRSLLVKISDEADSSSPLQSIDWKLKSSRRGEQRLKLTQSHWWVELCVPRQSYIFMWSSILVEESVLNIAIHKKHSLRQKALRKVSGDELLCDARIQFDDLWKHRAPEIQEIRCELVLSWPLEI